MIAPICHTVCGAQAGGAGGVYSATKIESVPSQTIQPGITEVDFENILFDVGPAITPDLADNALVINQDGFYEIIAQETFQSTESIFSSSIQVNGVVVASSGISAPLSAKAGTYSILVELEAGDRIELFVIVTATSTFTGTLSAEKQD